MTSVCTALTNNIYIEGWEVLKNVYTEIKSGQKHNLQYWENCFVTGSLDNQGDFSIAAENGGAVSKQEAGEDGPGQAQ